MLKDTLKLRSVVAAPTSVLFARTFFFLVFEFQRVWLLGASERDVLQDLVTFNSQILAGHGGVPGYRTRICYLAGEAHELEVVGAGVSS